MHNTQEPQPPRILRRSLRQSFNLRTLKYGSHVSVFTVIVLAVMVLLYAMAVKHNRRFDVTQTKRFTLADQSVKLLENLQHPIKIMGFFRLEDHGRERFEDLLKQYTYHSDNITYELVDPDHTVVVTDNGTEGKIFRPEENALTNAILRVTQGAKKVVYFVTGHDEPSLMDSDRGGYSLARRGLEEQNYVVKELLLARHEQLPNDAAVIIVAGPRNSLLEPELQELQAYLDHGGHLLFLLDPAAAPGLETFLQPYGIELTNDVVIETNALGRLFGGDYHIPAVTTYGEHPITKDFGGVMTIYPVVRSVNIAKDLPDGIRAQILASTSSQSWAETDLNALQEGRSVFDEEGDHKGPVSIAVVVSITPKPLPNTATTSESEDEPSRASHAARLVVFGDSEFANNNFFTLQGNGDMFLNTVSWLASEKALVSIRPREGGGSGPVTLTTAHQPLIFFVPVVFLPSAVFITGMIVCLRRSWQQ